MNYSALRPYLVSIGMLVTGALLAVVFLHRDRPRRQNEAALPSAPDSKVIASARNDSDRIAALEGKIANLQAERPPRSEHKHERARSGENYAPITLAERRRVLEAHWKAQLEVHASEPLDADWAPRAAQSLSSEIAKLSNELGFRFMRTDCRTTECAANLEFPNYESAQSTFKALLHANYQMNCGTEIVLPEPADAEKPYPATILYHCENG